VFVGYQAENTLGRRIQDGQSPVRIFGEPVERRAEIEVIGGYSAHADRGELRTWVKALGRPIKRAFVVHGEPESARAMATILEQEGVADVTVPRLGESFVL